MGTVQDTRSQEIGAIRSTVRRFLAEHSVRVAGRSVLAMCSGGPDSVALVDILATLSRGFRPGRLGVLFADHGLRDVDHDRACAEAVATRHGIEVFTVTAERGALLGGNLQARARDWRYAQAVAIARAKRFDLVATGHHASDQLETVLLGLITDGGIAAAGMRPLVTIEGVELMRPLLALRREDLLDYAAERQLEWAEDPSNDDRRFVRNRLRHDVVPALVAAHPGAGRNLARAAVRAAAAPRVTRELAEVVLSASHEPARRRLNIQALEPAAPEVRAEVCAAWLRAEGLGRAVTDRVVSAVSDLAAADAESRVVELRGATCRRDGYYLTLTAPPPNPRPTL
jgi:tRNA(Ile)-lysidine synthetase-like protein